jgi:hypothetical protein
MTIDFNTQPYNDDYNEDNRYYRILYKPSYAVQARELTQMQSILQNQIKRFGDNVFKQGAMVIPGQVSVQTITQPNSGINYVKLQSLNSNGIAVETFLSSLVGKTIVGQTTGVTAQVTQVAHASGSDPSTIYVNYTASGTNNSTSIFADGEIISTSDSLYTFNAYGTSGSGLTTATGLGSGASIQRGVYYFNGYFCLVEAQSIILDKYDNTPSKKIGLIWSESIVDSSEDASLLDNAQNSYNYAAPGADRYFIELTLVSYNLTDTTDPSFVELIRVTNGAIFTLTNTTSYNDPAAAIAQAIYDTEGNYTVNPFLLDIREDRTNNRGTWASNTAYLIDDIVTYNGNTYVAQNSGTSVSTPPTQTNGTAYDGPSNTGINWLYNANPAYNNGINVGGSVNNLAVGLEAGTAFVQGYEFTKLGTTYLTVPKPRTTVQLTNFVIPGPDDVGNYVLVSNLHGLPPINDGTHAPYQTINLYDTITGAAPGSAPSGGTLVGTARVRYIEFHSGDDPFDSSTVYKLGLFNVQMLPGYTFNQNVKSFYYGTFSSDISPVITQQTGSATTSGTSVTGYGTSFQTNFVVGDLIVFNIGSSQEFGKITAINSQTSITLAAALTTAESSQVSIGRCTTQILEPNSNSLIFPLPNYAINSVRTSTGTINANYTVYEQYTANASGTSVTFTTSNGTFESYAGVSNYVFCNITTGVVFTPAASQVSISGTSLTVSSLTSGQAVSGNVISVIAGVTRSGTGNEKTKTLVTTTVVINSQAQAQGNIVTLPNADLFKVISIRQADGQAWGSTPTSSQWVTDISENYTVNNGQTNEYYGLASLVLNPSYNVPTAPIQVTYQYFTHGQGDYFTVNSYNSIAYTDIPPTLRDSLDFRPRVADYSAGTAPNFSSSGSSFTTTPKRGVYFTADYSYYLGRTDAIVIDINGNFSDIQGVASLQPAAPSIPTNSMGLYSLSLEPYVFGTSSSSIVPTTISSRRYTMSDIAKLDTRISNLEYYTSLSMLEQSTQSLTTTDSTGLNRFKNGFAVDNFSGQNGLGNPTDPDYLCSIDSQNGILRPFYSMDNVNLIELNSNTAQRTASNYQVTGDIITLPYTTAPFITQSVASELENINPFAVYTFLGSVNLNPPSDDWFETTSLPDIVNNVMGNYNSILAAFQAANIVGANGVGTVWNAWQTIWSGASTITGVNVTSGNTIYSAYSQLTTGILNGTITNGSNFSANPGVTSTAQHGWSIDAGQYTANVTTATQVGQTRTGVAYSVQSETDYQTVGTSVVSTAVIPYIRSRNVLVQVKGLKPLTQVYPYFDSVSVASYCTPSVKMVYTLSSGSFDCTTNAGAQASASARQIAGDSQVCLNIGDVITGTVSGATAVVINKYTDYSTSALYLELANVIGTFNANETITGSISSAVGAVVSVTIPSNNNLVTNKLGELNFLFDIPNNSSLQFRTGTRTFTLLDTNTFTGDYTTKASGTYEATGILNTTQTTINAVQNANVVQEQVTDNQTVYQTSTNTITANGWYDPLAESFYVSSTGGAFLTSIDIYFASKDSNVPVTLQIRNMVNGNPGSLILPFSEVTLTPDQVNISSNDVVIADGSSWPTFDTPTTFTFETPVYVQDQTEYCFVLKSDSNGYNVWVSNMGDLIPGTDTYVTEQPYAGVMFLSQNASTWTPDQNRDIKFTINRAVFNTSVVGNVEFTNDIIPLDVLENNPFQTNVGSTTVRIWHPAHNMPANSTVKIDGFNAANNITGTITTSSTSSTVTGTGTAFSTQLVVGSCLYDDNMNLIGQVASISSNTSLTLTANATEALTGYQPNYINPISGIPASQIIGTHIISNVLFDAYTITVSTAATVAGYQGGAGWRASKNVQFDVLNPTIQMQTFPQCTTSFSAKTTSGQSINGSETPYITSSTFNPCIIGNNNSYYSPQMIASSVNEAANLSGNKSLTFSATMQTSIDTVSPVIDTTRASLICINNAINKPTESNTDLAALDVISVFSGSTGAFNLSGSTITSTNYAVRAAMATITPGSYITISSATNAGNDITVMVTGYSDTNPGIFTSGSTGTGTLTVNGSFISESTSPATVSLRQLFVDETGPSGSSSISKYVTQPIKLAAASTYTKVMFSANIPIAANVLVYYKTCVGDSSQLATTDYVLMTPDSNIPYKQVGDLSFSDITYTVSNGVPYDTITIKLVMNSTSSSQIPLIKDFRVISCA